jgi:hypothetical protein
MNRFTIKRGGDGASEEIGDGAQSANFELAGDERVTPALLVLSDVGGRDVGIGAVIDCGSMFVVKDERELYGATAARVGPVGLLVAALPKTD